MKPETKFYAKIKKNITTISWIRLENLSVPGTPDLLGYNNSGIFFTVELKHTKTNKVGQNVYFFRRTDHRLFRGTEK